MGQYLFFAGCIGGGLQLFQNSPYFLEMLQNKPLEHFWNCSETFSKMFYYNSGTFIERYMGQILERSSTIVQEKLKCLF